MNKDLTSIKEKKALLISMPFPIPYTPSIQLGTLSCYLKSKGFPVDVHHAYLSCANILSPELYSIISSEMVDEIFYPYFLFPDNFKKHRAQIEHYFNSILRRFPSIGPVSLDEVLDRLSFFNAKLITEIDFSKYSLIGFSVTYDQLKSSLYLAREIKQRNPDAQIVFGGAYCTEDLGTSLLKTFPEIDFIASGEGEMTLASLIGEIASRNFGKIKGLGWRHSGNVKFNGAPEPVSLDGLPFPDFGEYFERLKVCSSATQEFCNKYLSIPLEGSRGCWWRKCTFCNLNAQYSHYRAKSIHQIVSEAKYQIDKFHCYSIKFVDNVQRVGDLRQLMTELKNLNGDLNIFLEIRAGQLKREDYSLMRDAGVKVVQIGVEAFGNRMLKKMNKGTTTIDNIASVKYCQELGILPVYNIIYNYPNEESLDLDETAESVKFLTGFIPPVSVHPMELAYNSPVFNQSDDYNIRHKQLRDDALWRFPEEIWQTLIPFYYDYAPFNERKDMTSAWLEIFNEWQHDGEARIARPLLFYQDALGFLTITDMRTKRPSKLRLEGAERELYLFCDCIQTKAAIYREFGMLLSSRVEIILDNWINKRLMFRDDEKFLSLAVRLNPTMSPLTYLSEMMPFYEEFLGGWRSPKPRWKMNLKLGSIAVIGLTLNIQKIPAWLRRFKRIVSSQFSTFRD